MDAESLTRRLAKHTEAKGIETITTDAHPLPIDYLSGCDACCVIGGDGTLLGVVEASVAQQVPVFGLNQGKLGFLATFSTEDIFAQLDSILEGNYQVAYRMLVRGKTASGPELIALNDIVIKTASMSRLITLKVLCNEDLVTYYRCDGMIFSTPTGSTAYNLSANGPIIHPSAHVIAMTPICPHTLSNRSVIFSKDVTLRVENSGSEHACVSADGKEFGSEEHFPLEIKADDRMLPLLQPLDYSHFRILRNKLSWGKDDS